eukprot:TRINITY_DN2297_c0_g2_i6.p1 TRINITY_DN2297_c0_g2~~TRINITY_DN2297_c0_g2_i6.p1  ORF type:complete len:199 (+),score=36.89 TRINITY_DN2297_c0_g2_i6:81-677(+)
MALYEKAWELYESEFRQLHAETSDLLQILVDDYEKQLYDIREANEEDKKNDERLKSIRRDCMLKMVKLRELASHLQDVVKVQPASLQVYAGALASSCEMELQRMQVIYDRVNNKIRDTLVDTVYYAEVCSIRITCSFLMGHQSVHVSTNLCLCVKTLIMFVVMVFLLPISWNAFFPTHHKVLSLFLTKTWISIHLLWY